MPKGAGQHKQRGAFAKPRGVSGRTRTFTNLDIVRMHLERGEKTQAQQLLQDIRAGRKPAQ